MQTKHLCVLIFIRKRMMLVLVNILNPPENLTDRFKVVLFYGLFLLFMFYLYLYYAVMSVRCGLMVDC